MKWSDSKDRTLPKGAPCVKVVDFFQSFCDNSTRSFPYLNFFVSFFHEGTLDLSALSTPVRCKSDGRGARAMPGRRGVADFSVGSASWRRAADFRNERKWNGLLFPLSAWVHLLSELSMDCGGSGRGHFDGAVSGDSSVSRRDWLSQLESRHSRTLATLDSRSGGFCTGRWHPSPFRLQYERLCAPDNCTGIPNASRYCLRRSPICLQRVCEGGVLCGGLSGRCPRLHSLVSRSGRTAGMRRERDCHPRAHCPAVGSSRASGGGGPKSPMASPDMWNGASRFSHVAIYAGAHGTPETRLGP